MRQRGAGERAVGPVAVDALRERILQDGRNLGRGILKVDSFLNHQVDPLLIDACGRELASRFQRVGATKVLTAEISGIAPAVTIGSSSSMISWRLGRPSSAWPGWLRPRVRSWSVSARSSRNRSRADGRR